MSASQRTAVGQVPRVPPTNLTHNKKPRRVGWWVGVGKAQMYPSPSVYSFCPPFPVFNLVNTCCSYNMLRGQNPSPPPLAFTGFSPSLPQSVCLLVQAAAALSSLIVPRLPPQRPSSAPITPLVSWETIGEVRGRSCWNSHTQTLWITHMPTHVKHALVGIHYTRKIFFLFPFFPKSKQL